MPKDKEEKVEEPKKKMVVVEEVSVEDTPVEKENETSEIKKEEKVVAIAPMVEDENDKTNYLWIIIPTALLVGALVGGLITYFSGISKLGTSVTPSPIATVEPTVVATPTAAPTTTVKREDLKVQILNGSGVSGEAGKAKTLLLGLGYKNVDTGNASSSDFTQTEVAIKATASDALNMVIKDLSTKYSAVEASKPLATSSKYDLVITIGKK